MDPALVGKLGNTGTIADLQGRWLNMQVVMAEGVTKAAADAQLMAVQVEASLTGLRQLIGGVCGVNLWEAPEAAPNAARRASL